MRKSIIVLIACVLIFGLSTVSFAAEKIVVPAEKHATSMEAVKRAAGTIGAIDMKAGTLMVKEKKGELTVSVDNATKIFAGKSHKTLADLKSGEKVFIHYEIVDGKNIAKRINVVTVVASQQSVPATKKAEEKSTAPAKATR
jgi:Cu/Ag efflux protein CusF